jgi:hypothetical protein
VREDGRTVCGEEWQEKLWHGGMEEAPENGKESTHSAHASGIEQNMGNNQIIVCINAL